MRELHQASRSPPVIPDGSRNHALLVGRMRNSCLTISAATDVPDRRTTRPAMNNTKATRSSIRAGQSINRLSDWPTRRVSCDSNRTPVLDKLTVFPQPSFEVPLPLGTRYRSDIEIGNRRLDLASPRRADRTEAAEVIIRLASGHHRTTAVILSQKVIKAL
jgi:hypothetical protein